MTSNPETTPNPVAEAKALIDRGQNLGAGRRIQDFPEILRCFGEATRLLEPLCGDPNNPLRDLLAVAYTHQGFTLLTTRDEAAFQMSVASFDRAIALRTTLLGLGEPWFRYNLVGVWINRADVLIQRGPRDRLPEALKAYDEAVGLAEELDRSVHPAFGWRRAVARLNRAGATLRLFDPSTLDRVESDFEGVLKELEPLPAPKAVAVASALTGLAEVSLRRTNTEKARHYADQALQALASDDADNFETVQTSLRARLLLGAVSRKEEDQPGQKVRDAGVKAADQIEEGLAMALARPERALLMPLIIESYVHCTRAYATRQPQFLTEFLREYLWKGAPDLTTPQMLRFAIQELDLTLNRFLNQFSGGGIPSMQRDSIKSVYETILGMRELRAELAAKLSGGSPGDLGGPEPAPVPLNR